MLACVGFAMATVLVLNQLRKAASHLEVFVFPLSAVSLALFGLLPNTGLVRLDLPTPLFVHIVLALLVIASSPWPHYKRFTSPHLIGL